MIRLLLTTVLLAAVASPAHAVCSTAALDGNWLLKAESATDGCIAKVSGGAISGSCGKGTIRLSSSCAVTGKLQGATFRGRTEAVPSPNRAKPNLVMGYGEDIGGFIGFRQ